MAGPVPGGAEKAAIRSTTAIRWPQPGTVEVLTDVALPEPRPSDVVVDIAVSVTSTGTERARFSALPNATVEFPHAPGYMAAGAVAEDGAGLVAGTRVAVRGAPHQRHAVVERDYVYVVSESVSLVNAALWELALTALNGLDRGEYRRSEPVAVVGAGLVGALLRRLAAARGTPFCLVAAASDSKRWTTDRERNVRFVVTDELGDDIGVYPLVVDATGTAEGLVASSRLVAADGRIVLLGSPRASIAPVPVADLQRRGVRIVGAHIQTLAARSEQDNVEYLVNLTEEFFGHLDGGLSFDDLLHWSSPFFAASATEELFSGRSRVGVVFDWTKAE